jgi:hypothetical protein
VKTAFDIILGIALGSGALLAYWLPTIIARSRKVPNAGSVAVVNTFAILFVPWVVALAMACRSIPDSILGAGLSQIPPWPGGDERFYRQP